MRDGGMRDIMQGDGRLRQETRQLMVELNRETLNDIERLLPSELMSLLRDTYNRKSFPDVYQDALSAEPLIQAAYARTAELLGEMARLCGEELGVPLAVVLLPSPHRR